MGSPKTVIYCRVSTSHHDQNPDVQVDELRRYCGARNWQITEEIIDHGYSGGTDQRPGLKRLLALVRSRSVDAVVVLKLDRLFRSLKHLLTTLEEFHVLGVIFIATQDQVDYSTAGGRFFISVLGSMSQFEKELCRERTLMGLQHARNLGKSLGRPRKHKAETIVALRKRGLSYREIRDQTGIPLGCISRALRGERKSGPKFVGGKSCVP